MFTDPVINKIERIEGRTLIRVNVYDFLTTNTVFLIPAPCLALMLLWYRQLLRFCEKAGQYPFMSLGVRLWDVASPAHFFVMCALLALMESASSPSPAAYSMDIAFGQLSICALLLHKRCVVRRFAGLFWPIVGNLLIIAYGVLSFLDAAHSVNQAVFIGLAFAAFLVILLGVVGLFIWNMTSCLTCVVEELIADLAIARRKVVVDAETHPEPRHSIGTSTIT